MIQTGVLYLIAFLGTLVAAGLFISTDEPSNFAKLVEALKENAKHKRELEVKKIQAQTELTKAQLGPHTGL